MNIPYEEWGSAIRESAERLGAKFDANKLASQLMERGTTLVRKHRKRKVEIALAVGFVGGVAATLIVNRLIASAKRKENRIRKIEDEVEQLRHEPEDEEIPEAEETE